MDVFNQSLVSIITPTYNHEKYIQECIESVINQTYSNWEMIIVNDGSLDNTEEIILEIAKNDIRIKYFKQENIGLYRLSETYNFALERSTGDFIAILEGDDYWYPSYLSSQLEFFKNESVDFTWCKANVVNDNKDILTHYPKTFNYSIFNNPCSSVIQTLLIDFPFPLSWIFRKKKLTEIGGFLQNPVIPTVDLSTILEFSRRSLFHYSDQALVAYRRQIQQATRKYTVEISQGMNVVVLEHLKKLSNAELHNIGMSINKIKMILNNKNTIAYSIHGRSCLVRKEFATARTSFFKSFTNSSSLLLSWRIKSFIGFILSFFRLDLEWIASSLGKKTYN